MGPGFESLKVHHPMWGTKEKKQKMNVKSIQEVSVINGEGPPVPIPNTVVKLTCADNTRLETAR